MFKNLFLTGDGVNAFRDFCYLMNIDVKNGKCRRVFL